MTRSNSTSRRALLGCLASTSLLTALALGCDMPLYRASETISDVFSTDSAPKIVVETFNGSIDLSNGQGNEVVVEVTKRASGFDDAKAAANLENIEVSLTQEGNEVHVRVKRVGSTVGDCGASVIIAAPADAQVQLKSSNGYIVSEGMRGSVEARTSNAKVDVVEATGRIDVDSSNGAILIEAKDAHVDAHTSNASIRFKGSLADQEHEFSTSNGSIDVVFPAEMPFRFEAATSNGGIDVDFPFDDNHSRSRRKKSGIVGQDPKCSIELSTSNASIDIRKAK
jgi:DUF4097 and DUF4098 domain-containing protein YvlB